MSYPELSDDVRKVLTKLGSIEREVTSREGGHYIARVLPYRSVDNFIAGAVLTFMDVTSTVKAESALRESEARLRTLLAELQHRVRNTLALVKSITARTADSSETVEEMSQRLTGRLDAFARVQAEVTRDPDSGVGLSQLLAAELAAHAAEDGEHVTIKGPELALRPKAAETFSLALHELTTNAVKHGALKNAKGKLVVRWKFQGQDGNRVLHFEWLESGRAVKVDGPVRQGFGMELLTRILPYDIGAKTKVEFNGQGLSFTMDMPMENIVAHD